MIAASYLEILVITTAFASALILAVSLTALAIHLLVEGEYFRLGLCLGTLVVLISTVAWIGTVTG